MRPKYLAFVLALTAGCGTGDDSWTIDTGVPGDKPVDQLTDAEFQTFCADVARSDVFQEVAAEGCRFTSLLTLVLLPDPLASDSELRSQCALLEAECRAQMVTCTRTSTPCAATVSQYTTCVADSARALVLFLPNQPTCSNLTRASLDDFSARYGMNTVLPTPDSCAAIEPLCPSLMGGS
jgi:hypothetical protein